MATQQNKKDAAQRRADLAAKQAAMARAERRRKTGWGVGIGVLVAALIVGLTLFAIHTNTKDKAQADASQSAASVVGDAVPAHQATGLHAADVVRQPTGRPRQP